MARSTTTTKIAATGTEVMPMAVQKLADALAALDAAKRAQASADAEVIASREAVRKAEKAAEDADTDDGAAADDRLRAAKAHARAAAATAEDAERGVARAERGVLKVIDAANTAHREAVAARLREITAVYAVEVQRIIPLLAEANALRNVLNMMGLAGIRLPADLADPMRPLDLGAPALTPTTPELFVAREARHLIDRARRVEDQVDRRQPSAA